MADRIVETFSVVVNKPADEVFAFISDVNNHAKWSATAYRVEEVSDPSFAAGSTFASYGVSRDSDDKRNEVTVLANDANELFSLSSLEDGEEYINSFSLTPEGDGTKVDKVIDMPKPGGPMGMMFAGIFKSVIAPRISESMDKLKEVVES
ncbi:MAG: SRPBCC family protein [Actinobacteria bacterium]|nr:SRPBCC family protein [Actinomycetota bacterium]